jgi:hypothetical protein
VSVATSPDELDELDELPVELDEPPVYPPPELPLPLPVFPPPVYPPPLSPVLPLPPCAKSGLANIVIIVPAKITRPN